MILMRSLIVDETATNNFWKNKNLHICIIPFVCLSFIPFRRAIVLSIRAWFFFLSVFLSPHFHSILIAVSHFSLMYSVHCFVRVNNLNLDGIYMYKRIFLVDITNDTSTNEVKNQENS